tara:strand:- start:157 stop:489 length:333 start_codon:yes stop_codon:yes gene_type:complete
MITITGSKLWIINFYREQLIKFNKIGLGKFTEFNVRVTKKLIRATEKRLKDLTVVYDNRMSPQALILRKQKISKLRKERLLNGQQTNSNGTIATSCSQDNSSTGHEGSKS